MLKSLPRLLPLSLGLVQALTANIEDISKVKVSLTKDLKENGQEVHSKKKKN